MTKHTKEQKISDKLKLVFLEKKFDMQIRKCTPIEGAEVLCQGDGKRKEL